jgi:hypothetical protein
MKHGIGSKVFIDRYAGLWLVLIAFPLVATFSYMYSQSILFYASLVFLAYVVP